MSLRGLSAAGVWRAVGEQGAFYWGYESEEPLTQLDTGTTEPLVWGSVSNACWSARTANGELLDSCGMEPLLCDPTRGLQHVEYLPKDNLGFRSASLIDASGTPYRRATWLNAEGPVWCALPTLNEAVVLETSVALCGDVVNWLLLTEAALYVAGSDALFCAIE